MKPALDLRDIEEVKTYGSQAETGDQDDRVRSHAANSATGRGSRSGSRRGAKLMDETTIYHSRKEAEHPTTSTGKDGPTTRKQSRSPRRSHSVAPDTQQSQSSRKSRSRPPDTQRTISRGQTGRGVTCTERARLPPRLTDTKHTSRAVRENQSQRPSREDGSHLGYVLEGSGFWGGLGDQIFLPRPSLDDIERSRRKHRRTKHRRGN